MQNTLTAAELKRRGMAAIEDGLRHGPVRIIKRNKPAAVVVSAEEYERLSTAQQVPAPGMSALQWLLAHPSKGTLDKREIDRRLREERDW
jgi:fructoselysine-6-P-deglycase FrlB-like protein